MRRVEAAQITCPFLQEALERAEERLVEKGFGQDGAPAYLGPESNYAVPRQTEETSEPCGMCEDGCRAKVWVRWVLPEMKGMKVLNPETGEKRNAVAYDLMNPDQRKVVLWVYEAECVFDE